MTPTTDGHPDADDLNAADLNDADRSEAEQADAEQAGIDAPEGFDSALLDDDDPQAGDPENGDPETGQPVNELEAARLELGQAQDQNLRLQAELENFRTRMRREMAEERRFALMPLVRDLLPAMDNVARAIEAAEKEGDAAGLLDGFKLVAQQIESILGQHQCTRIEALHQPFDPHLHAAITQQPSDEYPAGTVLLVAQQGYELNGRVVRPAQVIVSIQPPSE